MGHAFEAVAAARLSGALSPPQKKQRVRFMDDMDGEGLRQGLDETLSEHESELRALREEVCAEKRLRVQDQVAAAAETARVLEELACVRAKFHTLFNAVSSVFQSKNVFPPVVE